METGEKNVVLMLADISGYTKFMVSNDKSLTHSNMVIGELITSLLKEVDLPVNIAKLEGDAVFLYALKDPATWDESRKQIADKIRTFFQVFSDKVSELTLGNICQCSACANIDRLKLKIIIHSGRALFFQLGNFLELSGVDVIIAHRLLKNSVQAHEYILLTEAAYNDLALPHERAMTSREVYEDIGAISTHIYPPELPRPYQPLPNAEHPFNAIFVETLRSEISREYTQVAQSPEKGFHFHTGRPLAKILGYKEDWMNGVPERSVESLAGTGNPFAIGELGAGEHVVDVGCGAGMDSLIAAKMVGASGGVIGVDMTPAMLVKARTSASEMRSGNVNFLRSYAESIPVPNAWADVIISNGVLNLMPDKKIALQEMFRVLKPGGRLQIGDILVQKQVPNEAKRDIDLWAG